MIRPITHDPQLDDALDDARTKLITAAVVWLRTDSRPMTALRQRRAAEMHDAVEKYLAARDAWVDARIAQ